MEDEIWMPIKGYEGIYEVSHYGRVKRVLLSKGTGGGVLKASNSISALHVGLAKNGVTTIMKVHTLVLTTFNCERPKNLECCHADGDFKNNYIGNLRWDTCYNNHQDKIKHDTCYRPIQKGGNNNNSKLNEDDVINIKAMLHSGVKPKVISEKYRIQKSAVSKIKVGVTWSHIKTLL